MTLFDMPESEQKPLNDEWYTPHSHIEAARATLGSIDLDPASCPLANETVRASTYYTIDDDGSSKKWTGRVWLNPPYSKRGNNKSGIEPWVRKLIREHRHGEISAAILLTTADTDAGWFQWLWDYLICFPLQRVYFHRPGGKIDSQIMGNVFTYLGPDEQRFIKNFSQFGRVVKAVDTPAPRPIAHELWKGEVGA